MHMTGNLKKEIQYYQFLINNNNKYIRVIFICKESIISNFSNILLFQKLYTMRNSAHFIPNT